MHLSCQVRAGGLVFGHLVVEHPIPTTRGVRPEVIVTIVSKLVETTYLGDEIKLLIYIYIGVI